MGREPCDNLLAEECLLPGYRPADLGRQGFFVVDDKIAIDRDDAIFDRAGEALFDADGEPSERLGRIRHAVQTLHHGLPETEAIIARFLRSEEHTSELQSLMRNSYAVFCLKKNTLI